jgi:pectate lyase
VLDTGAFTVTPGTWYRLRFEAIGSSLRAYVNNQLLLEANDTTYPTGRYGAVMSRTAARYDDFVALEP